MACIIGELSRRSWTKVSLFQYFAYTLYIDDRKTSEMCLDALNSVFRCDVTGIASLEVVRILNRMVKERRFQIHPNVLSCLLNLRLKSELNIRASDSKADNAGRATDRRSKGKATDHPYLNKKARKALKERKEIEKEFREAEAVVDKEDRAAIVGVVVQIYGPPLIQELFSKANRDAETLICSVLSDIEEPDSNSSSSGSSPWDF